MTKRHILWRRGESSGWPFPDEWGTGKRKETNTERTQPLPLSFLRTQWYKPTVTELRYSCGMSQYELAQASGVRYCRVAWIERGIRSSRVEIDKVLAVLSGHLRMPYCIEDCEGLKVDEREVSV